MIVLIFAGVSLITGVIIQCNFKNSDWDILETQYTCWSATITSDGNLTHAIGVTGDHKSGKTNANVQGFYIYSSHQHLNCIPKGIEQFFPDLLGFMWNSGNLTILTAEDLEPFPYLEVFDVYDNKLVSLEGDLFKYTPNLIRINFERNLLEYVSSGLLDGLKNLRIADFRANSCINVNGKTPAAIQELKQKLQNQCHHLKATTMSTTSSTQTSVAPTTTTRTSNESGQYSIKCVELIETLKEDIKKQSEKNARQDEKITAQADEILALGDAIKEVEKQIRELWARS